MIGRASAFSTRFVLLASAALIAVPTAAVAKPKMTGKPTAPKEVARDVSLPLSVISANAPHRTLDIDVDADGITDLEALREEHEHEFGNDAPGGNAIDNARQNSLAAPMVSGTMANFEGLSNEDNFNIFGGRVNPPDPVGAVGPNHYVEMINLVVGVYDKSGAVLVPATDIGALWAGFAVDDCTDPSGDPVVVYDQDKDRWILSQFTTRGPEFFNCIAVSTSGDPTGSYYRYAFSTGLNFPDYPKYGNWKDAYVITTREFGPNLGYGIGVYALEKDEMTKGKPARAIGFFLEAFDDATGEEGPIPLALVGDGLLPAYWDGKTKPKNGDAIPIIGTQDDGGGYGATFDALNIWDLTVKWKAKPDASLTLNTQLPVASFDSIYPCAPTARDCLPEPGITNPAQFVDILSYRQRPTWRLAYRNFKHYDAMVTTQSVEAAPSVAGMRWYEIRRVGATYSVFQQGTYAPADGVHRWMGSVAQDQQGNIGLAYSVVNGVDVFPGIRFTGRLAGDPLGQMTLGEGTIIDGTGVQTTTNSRWGDYTSLNVDPVDDCTMWYVNEYYTLAGQATSTAGWQTRIGSFKLPGCH